MVTSIARQSVIIKCNQQTSVLLGNYEFYYLAGLMSKIFNLDLTEEQAPKELHDKIQEALDTLKTDDAREQYLITLVSVFKPLEDYDVQMKELFVMGKHEDRMWIL